jgi:hypothetical protein
VDARTPPSVRLAGEYSAPTLAAALLARLCLDGRRTAADALRTLLLGVVGEERKEEGPEP